MTTAPSNGSGRRRVVVTGMGAITPVGASVRETWRNVLRGECGIDRISLFDASGFPSQIAGEVKHADSLARRCLGSRKYVRYMNRSTLFALAASEDAWRDARIPAGLVDPERFGVVMGVGLGSFPDISPLDELSTFYREYYANDGVRPCLDYEMLGRNTKRMDPARLFQKTYNTASALLAMRHGARGPCVTVVTACASSAQAIGEAYRSIQHGETDIAIAGGCDAPVNELSLTGFCLLGALSKRNTAPAQACRPFDRQRDGFILAEGAGVVILEDHDHAQGRGAQICAELIGYGCSADAYRITDPPEDGRGSAQAIRAALRDARITAEDVDYVNAHGTSTHLNDKCETRGLKAAFGEHAFRVPVSATKSTMGHLVAAAGAVELIVTVQALRKGLLPPTINHEHADPDCDLDYVPNRARRARIDVAVSNSFAFGGHNASLVVRRYNGSAP